MSKYAGSALLWLGAILITVLLAGFAELSMGGRKIITALGLIVDSPQLMAAFATGNTSGCDKRAYDASIDLLKVRGERLRLKQVSTKLGAEGALNRWNTPDGVYWAPNRTDFFYVLAEQTLDVYQTAGHKVRKGDIVLDCGANLGVFTRKALSMGASKVIAIEPVPDNIVSMSKTFEKEIAEGRVIIAPVGVWNKDDVLKMTMFDNSVLDSFVMRERDEAIAQEKQLELPLTTVDALVAKYNLERVDFIKMDVEGAERQALAGAKQTIAKFRPRMSIATENLEDDYLAVPRTIKGIDPAYTSSCGGCKLVGIARVRPDVMFFAPQPSVVSQNR